MAKLKKKFKYRLNIFSRKNKNTEAFFREIKDNIEKNKAILKANTNN